MGANRQSEQNGRANDAAPRSKAREIASRGDSPSAANLGSLVHAAINDVLLGGLDRRDAATACGGVRTFVTVARNREVVDDLAAEIAATNNNKQREREELLNRLAELDRE